MNTAVPISRWKTALNMMINPGEVVKNQMGKVPWPYSLLVSGLSFTLFFLQTGLDMLRSGQIETSGVILISMLGLLYGTAGVALIAVMVWALAQAGERNITMGWAVSSFALGYSATLVYAVTELFFLCSLAGKQRLLLG